MIAPVDPYKIKSRENPHAAATAVAALWPIPVIKKSDHKQARNIHPRLFYLPIGLFLPNLFQDFQNHSVI